MTPLGINDNKNTP